ncbi:MAG: hypothetical protein ABI442_20325 [Gemmatimonadaceae bacterium]
MLDFASDLSRALLSNYSGFPNSCLLVQFSLGVDAFEVFVESRDCHLKQFRDERLSQPEHVVAESAFDAGAVALGLIEDKSLSLALLAHPPAADFDSTAPTLSSPLSSVGNTGVAQGGESARQLGICGDPFVNRLKLFGDPELRVDLRLRGPSSAELAG